MRHLCQILVSNFACYVILDMKMRGCKGEAIGKRL